MVNLRINETLQIGAVRKPHLPFSRLVGTVSNCADAVRLETALTGEAKVAIRNVGIRRSLLQENQMTLFLLGEMSILTTTPQLPRLHLLG